MPPQVPQGSLKGQIQNGDLKRFRRNVSFSQRIDITHYNQLIPALANHGTDPGLKHQVATKKNYLHATSRLANP
jgi:hypothetical protein